MLNNKRYYPTYENMQKLWNALGASQKNIRTLQEQNVFTPAEAQDDSDAATVAELVTDFNLLLSKLRDAGIIQS